MKPPQVDLEHVCTSHAIMSKERAEGFLPPTAWGATTPTSLSSRILRRARVSGIKLSKFVKCGDRVSARHASRACISSSSASLMRRQIRTQRRHGMPIREPVILLSARAAEFAAMSPVWAACAALFGSKRVKADPSAFH
jgi:hypothetical protein